MVNKPTSRRSFLKNSTIIGTAFTIIPRHVLGKGFVPPSDKINIGFIGLGKQSAGLSKRFLELPEVQITGGCDVWSTKRDWFKNHVSQVYAELRNQNGYNGISTYENYHELLNAEAIDGVVIATPDHWHALQAIDSMKAGKDVYCEKPLTHTVDEGKKMVKTARKTKRIVQTGSMQRSDEKFRRACELVRNGYIGKIKKVYVNVGDPAITYDLPAESVPKEINWNRWCGPAPLLNYNHLLAPSNNSVRFWPRWRWFKETGGGNLCDWGAHMFDIVQWALGMDRSGPVEFIPPNKPNAVKGLTMKYESGVEIIHWNFGRGNAVRLVGSEGTIDVSRNFLDSNPSNILNAQLKASDEKLYDTKGNHYKDWINAVQNRTQPICDVETGHRSASVCNIANIAYWLNRPLTWNPKKECFKKDKEANKLLKKEYRPGYKL